MNITVKLPDGTEKSFSCSSFENVNGELYIFAGGDAPTVYGQGQWISYREVKNETV